MDRDNVIKGLEQFKSDFKPFCGNGSDWARVDAAIDLLKEQEEEIEKLKQTAQSMMEGICLLKEQENEDECCPICGIRRKYGNS